MPETAPGAIATSPPHVNSAQWQSFEMRMRQRRAARLILRAQTALEQGRVDEAEEALEEARTLDSSAPDVATLRARIAPLQQPATPVPPIPQPGAVDTLTVPDAHVPVVPAFKPPAENPAPVLPPFMSPPVSPTPVLPAVKPATANSIPVVPAFARAEASVVSELPLHDLSAAEDAPDVPARTRSRRVGVPIAIAASLSLVTLLALWPRSPRVTPAPAVAAAPPPVTTAPVASDPAVARQAVTIPTPPLTEAGPSLAAPAERKAEGVPAMPRADSPIDNPKPALAPSLPTSAPAPEPVTRIEPVREEPSEPIASLPIHAGVDAIIGSAVAPVPEPPTVAPPTSAPLPAEAAAVDETLPVRRVLMQYEAAYSSLDAAAARRVWPSLDARALTRAFEALQSQRVSLGRCDVSVTGTSARAACRGSAQWTPKVGGGARREPRQWSFDLRKSGGEWRIVDAIAR